MDRLPKDMIDRLMISLEHPNGGIEAEFMIAWENLCGDIVMRLEVFDEAWAFLVDMPELLSYMASISDTSVSIDVFAQALVTMGFEDKTVASSGDE
jgi:hypothetical protein